MGQDENDDLSLGKCIPFQVMADFLKLIYDPYISGVSLNAEAFDQKILLTVEYIREIRRIMSINNSCPGQPVEDLVPLVRWLILELRDLTDNYLTFRIASKGLKIPSTRDVKVWQEAMRDYTFKPNCKRTSAVNHDLAKHFSQRKGSHQLSNTADRFPPSRLQYEDN